MLTINDVVKNQKLYFFLVLLASFLLGAIFFFIFRYIKDTFGLLFALGIMALCVVIIVKRVVRLLWLALALCFVINFDITIGFTGHLGGAAGFVVSLYDIVLVMLYFLWVVDFIVKRRVNVRFFPQITVPFALLSLAIFISMIDGWSAMQSIYEYVELFKFYLTFLYVSNNIREKKDISYILFCIMIGFALESFLGVMQHRTGDPLVSTLFGSPSYLVNDRVAGTWVSYNDFSTYLTYFIPLSFILIFRKVPNLFRMVFAGALVFGGASLIWTNSRGGWLSCGISFFFMFVLLAGKLRGKDTLIKVFLGGLLVVILASPIYPRVVDKVVGRLTGDDNGSAESRLPQFEVAGNIIRAHPINGIGFNCYADVMLDYDTTEEGLLTITRFPVHNIYLHTLAELGILGMLAYAYLILSIFYNGLRYVLRFNDDNTFYIVAMLAGILAFLIHQLADLVTMGNKLYLYIWFFSGLIMSMNESKGLLTKKKAGVRH